VYVCAVCVCGEVLVWVMAYFCIGRRKGPLEIGSWPGLSACHCEEVKEGEG
jgi:hypothetical protein